MPDINPKNALVCIYKEDLFKNPEGNYGGSKLGSLVEAYLHQVDELDSAMDIPEPRRIQEEYRTIGGGRDVQQIAELGYEVAETTLELRWMTAIFLYYAMGKCATTFIDSNEVISVHSSTTPSYSSGTDTTTITLQTNLLSVTTYDRFYRLLNDPVSYTQLFSGDGTVQQTVTVPTRRTIQTVTSFTEDPGGTPTVLTRVALGVTPTADQYSLNDRTGTLIIGGTSVSGTDNYELIYTGTADDFQVVSCPSTSTIIVAGDATSYFDLSEDITLGHFKHIITGWELDDTDPFPSLGMHVEQAPGADDLKIDLLGVMVRSITITVEKDATASMSVDIICAYSKDVSAVSTKPAKQTDELLKWSDIHLTNSVWTYNATAIMGSTTVDWMEHCDSVEITIENDIDISMVLAGEYPDKRMIGTRDTTVKLHVFPQDDKMREIRNLKTPTDINMYGKTGWLAGDIDLTVELNREQVNDVDYIKFVFDKLRFNDYPDSIPSYEEKILGIDIEMKLAPHGSLVITAEDDRNKSYYERD